MSLGFHVPPDAFAADGDVKSTVEINSGTTNGPVLTNEDFFGTFVANIGDFNNDGVHDLAVDANVDSEGGTARGAVQILYMAGISPANAPTSLTDSVNSDVQIILQWTASTTLVLAV